MSKVTIINPSDAVTYLEILVNVSNVLRKDRENITEENKNLANSIISKSLMALDESLKKADAAQASIKFEEPKKEEHKAVMTVKKNEEPVQQKQEQKPVDVKTEDKKEEPLLNLEPIFASFVNKAYDAMKNNNGELSPEDKFELKTAFVEEIKGLNPDHVIVTDEAEADVTFACKIEDEALYKIKEEVLAEEDKIAERVLSNEPPAEENDSEETNTETNPNKDLMDEVDDIIGENSADTDTSDEPGGGSEEDTDDTVGEENSSEKITVEYIIANSQTYTDVLGYISKEFANREVCSDNKIPFLRWMESTMKQISNKKPTLVNMSNKKIGKETKTLTNQWLAESGK